MKARLQRLKIDHALKAGTDIGPVVDERQPAHGLAYIGIGRVQSETLLLPGAVSRMTGPSPPFQ
nr:hypothetical protein [Cupriavidus sp. IDO]